MTLRDTDLFVFRLYVQGESGEWVYRARFDTRDEALEDLAEKRRKYPDLTWRLARRTMLEEWLDV